MGQGAAEPYNDGMDIRNFDFDQPQLAHAMELGVPAAFMACVELPALIDSPSIFAAVCWGDFARSALTWSCSLEQGGLPAARAFDEGLRLASKHWPDADGPELRHEEFALACDPGSLRPARTPAWPAMAALAYQVDGDGQEADLSERSLRAGMQALATACGYAGDWEAGFAIMEFTYAEDGPDEFDLLEIQRAAMRLCAARTQADELRSSSSPARPAPKSKTL